MTQAERAAREERAALIQSTEPTVQKLQRGERLSVEERTALDAQHVKIADLNSEIRTYEQARAVSDAAGSVAPEPQGTEAERREADFSAYLKRGAVSTELRAAGEATGSAGGYLVPPGWWQRLQVALKAYGGIAEDFQMLETESGQPMQWATVDPTAVVGTLITENTTISDVDYVFGQGTLSAYMYTSGVQKVSFQLANDSAFSVDNFVRDRVGESLGRAQAVAAISGSGSNQPLGIITALAAKSTTGTVGGAIAAAGGYVTLAAAAKTPMAVGDSTTTELLANTLTPSTLRSMIASVDPAYRKLGAKFYMNDIQLLGLRGQVDANGRPLINLQDGLTPGAPSTLWGYAVEVDQNVPNLAASTTGGPVFGHLQSAMVLRRVNQSGLIRLDQRYADVLQIGFIGYMRFDMRSNDLRAAVTVKAAAS